jgi:hypothetical protein
MPTGTLSDLTQRGLSLYEKKLKNVLEPDQNSRYVAIHVPTGDYALGDTSGDAMREILKQHPVDGQLIIRKIGPEPDYGMASRVLAGELLTAKQK